MTGPAAGAAESNRKFTEGPTRGVVEEPQPAEGIALCLSGGGYRAMLFHLGGLWRMCELGVLGRLDAVSAVSGGSMTAAALALGWDEIERAPDDAARTEAFAEHVAERVMGWAARTIDAWAVGLGLLLPFVTTNRVLATLLDRRLGGAAPSALPAGRPEFVFNATDLQTGELGMFRRDAMEGVRVGTVAEPPRRLARAVAASAAFPPFLAPARLRVRAPYDPDLREPGDDSRFTRRPSLADGGVYDNLGLEAVFAKRRTLLVSDAGGHIEDRPRSTHFWAFTSVRVGAIVDNQVRELRKEKLLHCYREGSRDGAYWGIRSDLRNFTKLADPMDAPFERTIELAAIRTQLRGMKRATIERLVNWGYAAADAGLRERVVQGAPQGRFPFPAAGVGDPDQP